MAQLPFNFGVMISKSREMLRLVSSQMVIFKRTLQPLTRTLSPLPLSQATILSSTTREVN